MSRLRCGQSGGLVAALVLGATAFAAPSPRVALRWQAALPVAPATRAALEAPVPRSPATDGVYKVRSIEEPVTFAWTLPEGAQGVLFELSATEDGFDAPTLQQEVEGEHLVLRLPAEGTWFWRLTARAHDRPDVAATPSAPWRLDLQTVKPPAAPAFSSPGFDEVLLEPRDGSPITLAWTPVEGAHHYEVRPAAPEDAAPLTSAAPTLTLPPLPEGEHTFVVRAMGKLEVPGAWSEPVRFHVGPPPAVRAGFSVPVPSLVADGASRVVVKVVLYDARGRQVAGATPTLRASAGALTAPAAREGEVSAVFVSPDEVPPGGAVVLEVRDRDFVAHRALPLTPPPIRVEVGARAGWNTGGASVSSPLAGVFVDVQTRWLKRRLIVSGRVGFRTGGTSLRLPRLEQPVDVALQLMPVSALLLYRLPAGALALHAGAGLAMVVVRVVQTDRPIEIAGVPGLPLVVGVSRELGPGRVLLEAGYTFASADGELARGRIGGVSVSLGYGVRL